MDYSLLKFLSLLGSVGLFLYGMKVMSEGLQKAAGERLRNILSIMTRNRLMGVLTGFMVTALVQSSSASIVMVVSFVNAGLVSLAQAMAVVMGANVGSAVMMWIISMGESGIKISSFMLPLIVVSLPLLFSRNSRNKSMGEFLIGFALLFIGLGLISEYVPNLQQNPEMFASLEQYVSMGFRSVLLFVGVGVVLTMVVQSSAATFAITIIMCSKGWIDFPLASAMILGANIGTTITPILASMSGNAAAKRTALGHLLFNIVGNIWALALFKPFVEFNAWAGSAMGLSNSGALALVYTTFNVITLLISIWFTPLYVKVFEKLIPSKNKEDEEFTLRYISGGLLSASELNIAQAEKEITVFADRVQRMLDMARTLVQNKGNNEEFNNTYSRLEKYEDISDRMEIEIANYLNRTAQGRLSNAGKRRLTSLLRIVSEVESIADCCMGMGKILIRKQQAHIHFTDGIKDNVDTMFTYVEQAMKMMTAMLKDVEHVSEPELMASYNKEREINNLRNQFRAGNIENINNDAYEYQSGIYYMDLVSTLERTGDYIINVVDAVKDQQRRLPEQSIA